MKKYTLDASIRSQSGRKVKNLRLKGTLPATVYGKGLSSLSIEIDAAVFKSLYAHAGETSVVSLHIDDAIKPVLIHNVQVDPVSSAIQHVEFYQVDLTQKVKTNVPIVFVGEAPIVLSKTAVLLSLLTEVEVEALPNDLPEKIEVDVSILTELNQEILVSDLSVPDGVTMLTDVSVGVVKATEIVSKEAQEQEAQEQAKAQEAEAAQTEASAKVEQTEKVPSTPAIPEEKKE